MLVDVKDEVLAGEPLYNIKDATGKITDGNVKIELGTEVLEEGTPLNKALLDKVTQNLIAYNVLDKYEDEVDEITGYINGTETVFDGGSISNINPILLQNGNVFIAYYFNTRAFFVITSQSGSIIKSKTEMPLSYANYLKASLLHNGNIFVAAQNGYFMIYDQEGNVIKAEDRYYSSACSYVALTTMANGNVFIAFVGLSSYGYWAIYDQDGNVVKSPAVFNQATTYYISATALPNGNVFIAYRKYKSSTDDTGNFVIYSQNGMVKSETKFNTGSTQIINTKTTTNGNVFIAFRDDANSNYGTFVIYDQDGNLVKNETIFSAVNPTTYLSVSPLANGNAVITYRGSSNNGYYTIYDNLGNIVQSETTFKSSNVYDSIALELPNRDLFFVYNGTGGSFMIASSTKTYNRNFQIEGLGEPALGEKLNIWNKSLDKTKTYMDYRITSGMCVTLANGNILQIYYDNAQSNSKYLVLNTEGNIVKEPTLFNSTGAGQMYACRLANDYIALAYGNAQSGGKVQLLTPDGMEFYGSAFSVTTTALKSEGIKIAPLPNGNIFIVWADTAGRTYYTITNTSGTVVKEKTTVSSTSYFWVGNLSGGKVVVGWTYDSSSSSGDYTKFEIYQQDGSEYSVEISVASTYDYKSDMVALDGDNFIIFIGNTYYFYNGVNLRKSGTYAENVTGRPLAVKTTEGDTIVLYYAYRNSKYDGYYTIIDKTGNITKKDIIWGETDSTIYATSTNDGGVFVGYSPLTKDRMIALFLSRTNFVNTSKNSINGKPIDTILLEGFYQAIYDGEQYITKEVGV